MPGEPRLLTRASQVYMGMPYALSGGEEPFALVGGMLFEVSGRLLGPYQ